MEERDLDLDKIAYDALNLAAGKDYDVDLGLDNDEVEEEDKWASFLQEKKAEGN